MLIRNPAGCRCRCRGRRCRSSGRRRDVRSVIVTTWAVGYLSCMIIITRFLRIGTGAEAPFFSFPLINFFFFFFFFLVSPVSGDDTCRLSTGWWIEPEYRWARCGIFLQAVNRDRGRSTSRCMDVD
ncbi:uncharacterized protein K489DRAFT_245369 [Dissoconium aciculare CBS 342.82]|uniref:Uncharacterized protein n=1 Tax=Dissoconium aciculare CBS 342.82 TaxID=1314786 RepID=A0A6J3M3M6_9PEZI|nr:uncharacterized protein K489DRAFT_245369 [Dissoconium aciculare CBS 342.82]KAF1822503.1 hypothetical protein K489DRAFT_245369 [Dissoconium aciculare CBS 342.82]